jgi:hypothetical protein
VGLDHIDLQAAAAKVDIAYTPGLATAERMTTVWPQIREDLVMSTEAKECITKHMQIFPLTAQFMQ